VVAVSLKKNALMLMSKASAFIYFQF